MPAGAYILIEGVLKGCHTGNGGSYGNGHEQNAVRHRLVLVAVTHYFVERLVLRLDIERCAAKNSMKSVGHYSESKSNTAERHQGSPENPHGLHNKNELAISNFQYCG